MEQKKPNQERGRKYGGRSSFLDVGEPSRAPRRDEEGADFVGSTTEPEREYAEDSSTQGISNRPTKEEHAFPDVNAPAGDDAPTSAETTPKQQGGNRGGV